MARQKNDHSISARRPLFFLSRDRRGVAAIEAAFVLPPFLILLFGIIELGVYFTLQSALDVGVVATVEAQRTAMLTPSTYALPSATTLKTSISTYGGALLSVSNLTVDVRSLTSLAASSVAIGSADDACPTNSSSTGSAGSGASGPASVMVLRAQMTMPLLPGTKLLTITSTSIFSCPL